MFSSSRGDEQWLGGSTPYGGNPAGVVPRTEGLTEAEMQKIV